MRKSILACTVSVLMSPMASWALGMGNLQVNSTLNQALDAEIELHSVTKKDLDSLHIGLAPKNEYSRADIERSDFLSQFKFEVIQRGGKNYVTITTRKPFKEPFANFLIEAKWSSGRILREYTMLIDPPEFVKKNARPVTTAVTSRAAQVKRAPMKSAAEIVAEKKPGATPAAMTAEKTSELASGELIYGPTERNDTLWSIAKGMAPENVSIDQMMMALLRDNPDAFIDNNINNLKAGYVLRIKDASALTELNKTTARKQVKEQYQSWKEARKQQISTSNVVDRSDRSMDDAEKKDGELKLVASGEQVDSATQGSLSAQAGQLKEKLAIAGEQLESKEIENQELRERIKELESILETKTSLVTLKDESLAALQKQKELTQQAQEAGAEKAESPVEVAEQPVLAEEKVDPAAEQTMTEQAMVQEESKPEAAIDASTDSTMMEQPTEITGSDISGHIDPSVELAKQEMVEEKPAKMAMAESVKPETEIVAKEPKPEPKKEAKPKTKPKPKPVKKPEPVPEDDILQMLMSEEYLPYTAGGGALLVIILAWLGLRGRGKKEPEFEESILDSTIESADNDFDIADDSEMLEPESGTEVVSNDAETSFLSDFSADDMESLQPDDTEADPISEADVFMVYGRYQQAEELLKTAISQEPDRLDYQMKLLEVYHGDNLKDEFSVQADVVRDALKKSNDDYELTAEWTKAKSWAEKLGVDIEMPDSFDEDLSDDTFIPESDSDDTSDSLLETTDELSLDDISDELTLDTDDINLDDDTSLDDLDMSLDDSLDIPEEDDFELGDIDTDESSDESADEFELDLDDMDTSSDETTDELLDLDESTIDFDTSLDLDEDSETESTDSLDFDTDLEFDKDTEEDSSEMVLDLEETSDDELKLDIEKETAEGMLDVEDSSTDDMLDLDDDLEMTDSSDNEFMEEDTLSTADDELDLLDDDMDFDDLEEDFPELDAVGTKLDLAKAYIDMGDMDSASSILNEVIDEGNEEQKAQAQKLLSQTG